MKSLLYLLVFTAIAAIAGCYGCDHYDVVDNGKSRVVFARPGAFWNRNEGGTIKDSVFTAGKWNHGSGVLIGYDIETTEQQWPITLQLLTKDQLIEEYPLVIQYSVKPGEACKNLVLNFLDPRWLKYQNGDPLIPPHTSNDLRIVPVDPDTAFQNICGPILETTALNIRAAYGDISSTQMQDLLNQQFREALGRIKIVKQWVDEKGHIIWTNETTTPLDVFDLNAVIVKDRKPPKELSDARAILEERKIYVEQLKTRKERLAVDRQKKMEVAQQMAARNSSLNAILKKNPSILVYKRQQEFKEFIEQGLGKNVEVIILPENMSLNTVQRQ